MAQDGPKKWRLTTGKLYKIISGALLGSSWGQCGPSSAILAATSEIRPPKLDFAGFGQPLMTPMSEMITRNNQVKETTLWTMVIISGKWL